MSASSPRNSTHSSVASNPVVEVSPSPWQLISRKTRVESVVQPKPGHEVKTVETLPDKNKSRKLLKKVEVKKFHAATSASTPTTPVTTSNNRPQSLQSTHVKVSPVDFPADRWPPRPMRRKDIEAKPWYMLSFEEAVELHCGNDMRAENYPTYNKSFVTKLKSNNDDNTNKVAFGSTTHSNTSNKSTTPNTTKPKTSPIAKKKSKPTTPVSAPTVESEVEADVRARRLKVSELTMELDKVKREIAKIEAQSQAELAEVQSLIVRADVSDGEVAALQAQAAGIIATARATVLRLLQERAVQQQHRHREGVRRRSTLSYIPQTLWQQTVTSVTSKNIDRMEEVIAKEMRRNEVRTIVKRGLIRFAQQQRTKRIQKAAGHSHSQQTQSHHSHGHSKKKV